MSRPKVVLLGMVTKIPVGGVVWLVGQYAVGFQRLGFDVYYVEAHARTPSMFMETEDDDGVGKACAFIAEQLAPFGLGGRWAYHALHDDGACYGLSLAELQALYRDAALIINLHGGTVPLEEHAASERLVYLGTDPVDVELEVAQGQQITLDYLEPHVAFFTWGLNHGNPDCRVPWNDRFPFVPSPPPVVVDLWEEGPPPGPNFTTIGNWRQAYRDVEFEGERYTWSKHHEFMKVLDLPSRVDASLELALSSYGPDDEALLAERGPRVRPGLELSRDSGTYRDYIQRSLGEFSVAKDQNVRLRSGWFSERSATYLAAGRPVILQDTGFGNALPTGSGLIAFEGIEAAAAAIELIAGDYEAHAAAASAVAREFLNYDVVLGSMLEHLGISSPLGSRRRWAPAVHVPAALPADLVLTPGSRRPLVLDPGTVEAVRARPVPSVPAPAGPPAASIVVPVLDNLVCTRLALESVLDATAVPFELVVIDNGSRAETRDYLSVLSARNTRVRIVRNEANRGFAAAVNQGIRSSTADVVVLLNNDTIVTPGWLDGLLAHLAVEGIGLVTPVTNRCGNAAEVPTEYRTHGELLAEGAVRRASVPTATDLPVAVLFCAAIRREVIDAVGLLDERFELGMFEDDDYSLRVHAAGLRVVCAEDVLVHHFGEGTIGDLAAAGSYGALFDANRRRFEEKWGTIWTGHAGRPDASYDALVTRVRTAIERTTSPGEVVLVVSKGDDQLVDLPASRGWHFPRLADGGYAGCHPVDDYEAIRHLEELRDLGASYLVIPASCAWWLDHYALFAEHLDRSYRRLHADESAVVYDLRPPTSPTPPRMTGASMTLASQTDSTALSRAARGPSRDAICVVGMHRSGTSLVTRLLNILGVDLGPSDHLMAWVAGNPTGHWEHNGFLEINKELLSRLGGTWHDIPVFPQGWERAAALADLRRSARDLIDDDFAGSELWGWKDPRNCLTLPFWQSVVGEMRYVLVVRNPVDVSRSLSVRPKESLDVHRASELWLRHVHASLRHTAGHDRLIVFYEDLMEDWQIEFDRLASFLGVAAGDALDRALTAREFIEGELWHHRATVADVLDDPELGLGVKSTYLALRLAAAAQESDVALDLVGTLSEYAIDSREIEADNLEQIRRRTESAEREAAEAWDLLRQHRATFVQLVGPAPTPLAADDPYHQLVRDVHEQATQVLPEGCRVLVVSKGDDELLDIPGVDAWHFPRDPSGEYSGYHPSSGREAVDHVRELRAAGVGFMLFPKPYVWWLDHYRDLADYLADSAKPLGDGDACLIFQFIDIEDDDA